MILRGTSLEEVRRALGLGRGMISRYLYGKRKMSLRVAVRFEEVWDISHKLWLVPPKRDFIPPVLVRLPAQPRPSRSRRAA